MSDLRVIGIDPGPVPGIVVLDYDRHGVTAEALQCTHGLLPDVLDPLVADGAFIVRPVLIQIERFVVRGRTNKAQAITRDLVAEVNSVMLGTDARCLQRNASQVKHWATDTRLAATRLHAREHGGAHNLLELTKGMRHARDAARHALFAAVHDGGVPDPLSKSATEGARA